MSSLKKPGAVLELRALSWCRREAFDSSALATLWMRRSPIERAPALCALVVDPSKTAGCQVGMPPECDSSAPQRTFLCVFGWCWTLLETGNWGNTSNWFSGSMSTMPPRCPSRPTHLAPSVMSLPLVIFVNGSYESYVDDLL